MPPQTPAIPAPPQPPQDTAALSHGALNPSAASPELVDQFLALDEPTRTKLMSGWDDTKKRYMLAGLQGRRNRAANAAAPETDALHPDSARKSNSIASGLGSSLWSGLSGAVDILHDPGKLVEGEAESVKTAGKQAAQQVKSGASAIGKGELTAGGLQTARGLVTGASILDPFATGAVTKSNRLADEGRMREQLGEGLGDVLQLWAGSKTLKGPLASKPLSERAAGNKLHAATGADVDVIREVLPDLQKTAAANGKPRTIGEAQQLVSDTTDRLSAEFDHDFQAIKNNRIYTPVIKQRLSQILADNPQWRKTPEGLAKIQAINDAIKTYDRVGWTFEEMNKERSDLRTQIRSLNSQAPSDAAARLKVSAEIDAKKAVSDVMADTTNDWLSHSSGKPKAYYDALRQKQARLIDFEDHLDGEVTKLHNKQALHEELGPLGRFKFHAYVSPSSSGAVRAHMSGLTEAISAGPETAANARVRAAFASSKNPKMSAAVKSLPITALAENAKPDEKPKRRSAIPPPPEPPQ